QADKARGNASEAMLPADLVQLATGIEGRMQKCCEYYFADDPALGPEIARLRAGSGYRDLAGDLMGYAAIYRDKLDVVKHDKKHSRATALGDAVKTGEAILKALADSMGPDLKEASDLLARAWTLLLAIYAEVSATGRWLERSETGVDALYPSLF